MLGKAIQIAAIKVKDFGCTKRRMPQKCGGMEEIIC